MKRKSPHISDNPLVVSAKKLNLGLSEQSSVHDSEFGITKPAVHDFFSLKAEGGA